jgi:lipocalin
VAGTLELFIAAMEQGDFEAGAEFVDPTTELYAEMIKMAENIEAASAHQDPQKGNVGEFLRLSFAVTFAGGEYTVLSEEGNRARAQLTLPNAKLQHTVSLNQVQGKWYILAGRELLRQTGRPAPTPSTP